MRRSTSTPWLPTAWRPDLHSLLPRDAAAWRGPRLAWWYACGYLVLISVRSLIHLLAPDGGAHSIATIDTSIPGGANIIGLFGQWGGMQLLLAFLLWVLLLRYRGLTPLVLLVLLIEPGLRSLAGHLKPITTVGTAPGAVLNGAVVPVLMIALWLALCPVDAAPREAGS